MVGVAGGLAGVVTATSDQSLSPFSLEASTRTRYAVPLVSPVILYEVCAGLEMPWLSGLSQPVPATVHCSS